MNADVQLWTATVDALERRRYWPTLSSDERARAERFRREDDRRRFVAGRGWLREVLAGYVGRSPALLQFATGRRGKPHLVPPSAEDVPHFNVSHSGSWVVIAVGRCRVGVDVEDTNAPVDVDAIARTAFDPQEAALLEACAGEHERREMFFRLWTRKEAWVKATGDGLADAACSVTPSFPHGWSGVDFQLAPGYRSAVAVEGRLDTLTFSGEGLQRCKQTPA